MEFCSDIDILPLIVYDKVVKEYGAEAGTKVTRMSKIRKTPLGGRNIVGARVMEMRQRQHLLQKELVAILRGWGMDIGIASLSRLEGQKRLVQDFEIPILAKALGVSVNWLLGQENE